MRRRFVWLSLAALLLPVLGRAVWFYRGTYAPPAVEFPDYEGLAAPTPPVSTSQEPDLGAPAEGKMVVIDWSHGNQFDLPEIDALTQAIAALGGHTQVMLRPFESGGLPLDENLKFADAFVTLAPSQPFSASEEAAVRAFVAKGGRLLAVADPTRVTGGSGLTIDFSFGMRTFGDVAILNSLLEPFDLAFLRDYLYDIPNHEGNFRNLLLSRFTEDPLTAELSTVVFYGARSIQTREGRALILGDDSTYSSLTDRGDGLPVAALDPTGNALALGDLTFITEPYRQVADNGQLIANLAGFLLSGERSFDLEDYPFTFGQRVALIQNDAFGLKAETLSSVAALQRTLSALGTTLEVATSQPEGSDRILPGLYSPDNQLRSLLRGMDVTLPEDSPDGALTVPGLGTIQPAGTGLLLLSHDDQGTTLVLLAESEEMLAGLLGTLASGDLSGCLVHAQAAVCQVGAGGGFANGPSFPPDFFFDELGTPPPTPTLYAP